MSKVTMPEPAAIAVSVTGSPLYGYTEAHMEAYAAARVREALEEAGKRVMDAPITADMMYSDDAKALAFHASHRVITLIPK